MAQPFYAPYAILKFSVPESTVGLFDATLAIAGFGFKSRLGDYR